MNFERTCSGALILRALHIGFSKLGFMVTMSLDYAIEYAEFFDFGSRPF